MSNEREFLEWLAKQDRYWIPDSEVEEKFPDLEYRMIGVTKKYNPETGESKTPARDWQQGVKHGGVTD
jgi:hypothetical protein